MAMRKKSAKYALFWRLFFLGTALFAQSGPSADRERGEVSAEPLWRQALGGAVTGLPTVQAQSAVVALDGGNIRAYSVSGAFLWDYSARGKISPFVTRSREGTSYIARTSGVLIAVNRSGRELWRRSPGGPLSGPVISGWDGRLFVPTGKTISCYTASGNLLWARSFTESIALSPILDQGGGVALALENAEVLRIDPFGRIMNWQLAALPSALVSLSPAAGRLMPRILALHHNGSMEILGNPEEWYMPADPGAARVGLPRLSSPPLAAASRGNLVAITQRDGQALLLSVDEGKILWTGESHIRVHVRNGRPAPSEAAMLYDERGVYVLSPGGATGFTGNGRRLWFTTLENAAALPSFGDDGVLYSGSRDWILYAYKIEDRSRFQKQSLYGPAPEGSYGTAAPLPSPWADYYFRFEETELRTRLDRIGRAVLSGGVGENELAWTAYLMETIAGEYDKPGASLTHPAVQLRDRVRALRLLAHIGSRETIPFLTGVFKKDGEPAIKAAAAEAIGLIGVDPDGMAIQAFLDTLSGGGSLKDEQALTAVAAATGALCRFSGPPLSDMGVRILTLLAAAGQSAMVQQQARRELATLRK
jgi:outer membrane protein assembly factor BamB